MSEPKEPAFFRAEYERGPGYYSETYFGHWSGQPALGDAEPRNLQLPFVADRIARLIPGARHFVICRNPVERAIASWWQNARVGIDDRPFEAAIEANFERLEKGPRFEGEEGARVYAGLFADGGARTLVRHASYIDGGHYAEHVERFAGLFGADRVKVIFAEDLRRDPDGVVADCVRFLGLEPVRLKDKTAQNVSTSRGAAMTIRRIANLPGVGQLPLSLRKPVRRIFERLGRRSGGATPEVSASMRARLTEHFRPHNARLEILTGRDLSHWNG
jgi:hypothetical protein